MKIQGFSTVEYVGPDKDSPEDNFATVGSLQWRFSINPLYGGKKVALLSGLAANVLCDTKNYERISDEPTMTAMEWFWAEVEKRGAEVSEYLLNHFNPEPTVPGKPTIPWAPEPEPVMPPAESPVIPAEPEVPAIVPDTTVEVAPDVAEGDAESNLGGA